MEGNIFQLQYHSMFTIRQVRQGMSFFETIRLPSDLVPCYSLYGLETTKFYVALLNFLKRTKM